MSLLLGILKEVTGSSLIQKPDSDEEAVTLFDTVQKVFQKMLECMARSFRKQPEEGLRVLLPSRAGLLVNRRPVFARRTGVHGDVSSHTRAQLAFAGAVGLLGGVQLGVGGKLQGAGLPVLPLTSFRAWRGQRGDAVPSVPGAGGPRAHL